MLRERVHFFSEQEFLEMTFKLALDHNVLRLQGDRQAARNAKLSRNKNVYNAGHISPFFLVGYLLKLQCPPRFITIASDVLHFKLADKASKRCNKYRLLHVKSLISFLFTSF